MRSLAVASRPSLSECIHSIIYVLMILSVTRIMFNTVAVPLVRNVARGEECCEGRSSVSGQGVLPSGEWIVINLFMANCCHLANRL